MKPKRRKRRKSWPWVSDGGEGSAASSGGEEEARFIEARSRSRTRPG
jgi:hypothetical protein